MFPSFIVSFFFLLSFLLLISYIFQSFFWQAIFIFSFFLLSFLLLTSYFFSFFFSDKLFLQQDVRLKLRTLPSLDINTWLWILIIFSCSGQGQWPDQLSTAKDDDQPSSMAKDDNLTNSPHSQGCTKILKHKRLVCLHMVTPEMHLFPIHQSNLRAFNRISIALYSYYSFHSIEHVQHQWK